MMVKLGDVVNRVNGNVDRFTTDLQYYIGGEHYDSNELLIQKRGSIQKDINILGFKFHFPFQAKDVIFMSRNPHLRKAGMVNFSGLCSDSSYILRTKNNDVLYEMYLPIVLQTDDFWDYCETHKSGGVNFLVNWGTLAAYEFELPPITEQKEIADKVWAAYNLKESYKKMIEATDEMVKSRFIEMFGKCEKQQTIQSVCNLFIDGDWIEAKDQSESGIRLIQTGNVGDGVYLDKSDKARYITEETFRRLNCTEIFEGDILVSRLPEPVGRACVLPNVGKAITAVDCTIIRLKDIVTPEFFISFTQTSLYQGQIIANTAGSTRIRVSRSKLGEIKMPVPSIDEQKQFSAIVQQADKAKFELREAIKRVESMMKSLMNS